MKLEIPANEPLYVDLHFLFEHVGKKSSFRGLSAHLFIQFCSYYKFIISAINQAQLSISAGNLCVCRCLSHVSIFIFSARATQPGYPTLVANNDRTHKSPGTGATVDVIIYL